MSLVEFKAEAASAATAPTYSYWSWDQYMNKRALLVAEQTQNTNGAKKADKHLSRTTHYNDGFPCDRCRLVGKQWKLQNNTRKCKNQIEALDARWCARREARKQYIIKRIAELKILIITHIAMAQSDELNKEMALITDRLAALPPTAKLGVEHNRIIEQYRVELSELILEGQALKLNASSAHALVELGDSSALVELVDSPAGDSSALVD